MTHACCQRYMHISQQITMHLHISFCNDSVELYALLRRSLGAAEACVGPGELVKRERGGKRDRMLHCVRASKLPCLIIRRLSRLRN